MSRRRCRTEAILLLSMLLGARANAQVPTGEAQVKAEFVYNMLKFVEWPQTAFRSPMDSFVVAIIGGSETADATERFLRAKQIGERPLAIRRLKWDRSLHGVHAVFVSEPDAKKQQRALAATAKVGVLTIGDGEDFATRGGVIGLLIDDRKVRFDVNLDAAQAAGLRISFRLLALTRAVYATPSGPGARP